MRILLDTNVVLSALLWRGASWRLLAGLSRRPGVRLYSSPALIDELSDVLSRPRVATRLILLGRSVEQVLEDYTACIDRVEPVDVPRVVSSDIDDDKVIAAAIAARADWLVSGDSALLALRSHQGVEILPVAEAISRLSVSND